MESGAQSSTSQRAAAAVTLVLLAVLGVLVVALAFANILALLLSWLSLVLAVFAFSFELQSSGTKQQLWRVAIGVSLVVFVGSLVWLAFASPQGVLTAVAIAVAVGFLGPFALRQKAPTVGTLRAERPVLFVNPKSGGGKAANADIAAIAEERGIRVRVLERGDDLTELARAAIADGADAVGVAGGDGSLGYVATATIESGVPFICIPAGTRNHFARDLGLDRSKIVEALDAFTGEIRMIDYATANRRVFLNVASLGLYAEIVSDPAYRDAKVETAKETLRSLRAADQSFDLRFTDGIGETHDTADLIMVSCGQYEVKGAFADVGKRASLDDGHLGVLALTASDPVAAITAATLSAAGAIDRYQGWDQWVATEFTVHSDSPIPVGIDGETVSVEAPVSFRIHAGMFAVAVPTGTPYGPRVSPIGTIRDASRLWSVATSGR